MTLYPNSSPSNTTPEIRNLFMKDYMKLKGLFVLKKLSIKNQHPQHTLQNQTENKPYKQLLDFTMKPNVDKNSKNFLKSVVQTKTNKNPTSYLCQKSMLKIDSLRITSSA